MRGKEVFYPIGWDDNGLPTERRVQNYFGVRCDPSLPYDPEFEPPAQAAGRPQGRPMPPSQQIPVSRRNFVALCEQQTERDEQSYEEAWRRLGLSVDWSTKYRTIDERSRAVAQRGFLRNLARGEAYLAEGPSLWDVDIPHRGRAGRAGGQAGAGRVFQDRFSGQGRRFLSGQPRPASCGNGRSGGGDHPARAAARLRGAGRAPGRRAVRQPDRAHGPHAGVRRGRAGPRAPAGRAGQGHRHRDGVHVRRHDRRDLVA